jgi:tRNA1(Val) A37 N6-methylase TrmN6
MIDADDYLQPEFFRFGWDQFFLIETVMQFIHHKEIKQMIELGAGSGVITCELSQQLDIESVHLVEYQKIDWEPFLTHNIQKKAKTVETLYHWQSVGEFNRDKKIQASLIVANPPYFLPESGRRSEDPRRNIARRFVINSWQEWIDCMVRSLAPGGQAFWLHRDPGPPGRPILPPGFEWKHVKRSAKMRVICLSHNLEVIGIES